MKVQDNKMLSIQKLLIIANCMQKLLILNTYLNNSNINGSILRT